MTTQAHFSGIRETIVQHLDGAAESVFVAVAWFTDCTFFNSLISCLQRNVDVSVVVLDHCINRRASIPWDRFTELGGRLSWLPDEDRGSLHHKFCIVDGSTVSSGSFNWTYRASRGHENVFVVEGNATITKQFQNEVALLLAKHRPSLANSEVTRLRAVGLSRSLIE